MAGHPQNRVDHSWNKALSPERHDRQHDPDEKNRYQPDPTLVKMSLRENDQLQKRGNNRAAKWSLALPLYVTAKDEFFDKTRGESQPQKGKRLNGIFPTIWAKC
jgi:hypothetical protein